MPQGAAAARVPDEMFARLQDLYARLSDLKLRASDLQVRQSQIAEQRGNMPPAARAKLDAPWASVQHEYASTMIQIEDLQRQIADLQHARDMASTPPITIQGPPDPGDVAPQAITIQPPPAPPPFDREQVNLFASGAFLLMLPIVLAFARRVWMRSGRRAPGVDVDESPRLQRIEQAIESIAIEVERIGEAQRFTTKLLGERAADPVAARLPQAASIPRREPGTVTPH
jgi:hypothetical protein